MAPLPPVIITGSWGGLVVAVGQRRPLATRARATGHPGGSHAHYRRKTDSRGYWRVTSGTEREFLAPYALVYSWW